MPKRGSNEIIHKCQRCIPCKGCRNRGLLSGFYQCRQRCTLCTSCRNRGLFNGPYPDK